MPGFMPATYKAKISFGPTYYQYQTGMTVLKSTQYQYLSGMKGETKKTTHTMTSLVCSKVDTTSKTGPD
jgi:hypothetical protein